jgi:hypothetical protein
MTAKSVRFKYLERRFFDKKRGGGLRQNFIPKIVVRACSLDD